jgi:hypothetical protein
MSDLHSPTALEGVHGEGVYILNPLFRIRKENGYAVLHGMQGLGMWRIHLSHAVVLALRDGKRTVLDIAELTRPFVEKEDDSEAVSAALTHVTNIISHMSKTKEEQRGICIRDHCAG